MESPSSSILNWSNAILAGVFATIGAIVRHLITLKKLPSEVHKTDAEGSLADAQAGDLRLRTRLSVMEAFDEMSADIGDLQYEKIQLRREVADLKDTIKHRDEEISTLNKQLDQITAERMLKKLK